MADLSEKVAASLTRYNMLAPGDRVGVAVSGGADSVALLHVLSKSAQYELVVLHVNHHLRGDESDADEIFVRNLSEKLALPVEVKQAPIGPGNMEQVARDARRSFFAEALGLLKLRHVALGHNQTDQAETVLYRLMRGSGLAGLTGMLPVTKDGLIRPMLDATREEIRIWAAGQGIEWREDSSNENKDLARNRIRLEMMNPQLVSVLSANAGVARDEEEWWARRIETIYRQLAIKNAFGLQFQVDGVCQLHPAEQRRLLRRAIFTVKGDLKSIDLAHVEAIRKLLENQAGHDRVLIPGVDALRSFGTLLLTVPGRMGAQPRHYEELVKFSTELALPYDSGRLYVNTMKPGEPFCGNFGEEADLIPEIANLDGGVLFRFGKANCLLIRNWEPGDEYQRTGHDKSEKIKTLFQEYRILLWERRRWPVMVINDEIVWSRRFGAAAKFEASDASRDIVQILYRPGNGTTPL